MADTAALQGKQIRLTTCSQRTQSRTATQALFGKKKEAKSSSTKAPPQ